VASVLQKRLADSLIFDPEEVGRMLRSVLSRYHPVNDFQDYALWRELVPRIATSLLCAYGKTVIMPRTVWRKDYFENIIDSLCREKVKFIPIVLAGSRDILRKRILDRPETEGSHAWCLAHLDKSLASFRDRIFGAKIDTFRYLTGRSCPSGD